jgi:predicted RNA-binding protein YlqC (UPF0109 family)
MNDTIAETIGTIHATARTFTDDGIGVDVVRRSRSPLVEFHIRTQAPDMAKIVGKGGSHAKALNAIVERIGMTHDAAFALHVCEPFPGPAGGRSLECRTDHVDPEPYAEVLRLILAAVGITDVALQAAISRGPDRAAVMFTIYVRGAEAYRELTVPPPSGRDPMPLVAALGTILRAAGKKAGAIFEVEVVNAE